MAPFWMKFLHPRKVNVLSWVVSHTSNRRLASLYGVDILLDSSSFGDLFHIAKGKAC